MPDDENSATTHVDRSTFEGGPPRRLLTLAKLPAPLCPNDISRVTVAFVLSWVMLLFMVVATPESGRQAALDSFVNDVGVHARFAIAVPALVAAYAVCARRLGDVAYHFLFSSLLDNYGKARFTEAMARAGQLINSRWAEVITFVQAYIFSLLLYLFARPLLDGMAWAVAPDGRSLSLAGWWHLLVSLPLLSVLLFGWFWRILVWTLFLRKVAQLKLRLIASHPDQAAGLGFLSQSVQAFSILGLAIGSIAAGRFAYLHISGLGTGMRDGLLIGGTAVFVLFLCVGPLLMFTNLLFGAWRDGSRSYGSLATRLGTNLERKWFVHAQDRQEDILAVPDFSAGTDYYSIVSNVYRIRFVPVDLRSLIILMAATLAPFIPAMFLSMPSEVVIQELMGLFLH